MLTRHPEAVLAYSGLRHNYNRYARGPIEGGPLQLVQVLHRRSERRWIERSAVTTDDLDRMYWKALGQDGGFVPSGRITCEWVSHPEQRHKAIRESGGGLNTYRDRYRVQEPLRFQSSVGNPIDEVEHYRRFRERPDSSPAPNGLKILLVGELAYNPERVLALEERGHQLYGLWMPRPALFNTVGPVPFGHVIDLDRSRWREEVARIKPDIIYALLNWQTVPFAHEVLQDNPGIPFVWHFKEGPFICIEHGTWSSSHTWHFTPMARSTRRPSSDPGFGWLSRGVRTRSDRSSWTEICPVRKWMSDERSPLLSEEDGELHTVVPGRPIGLHVSVIHELADLGIHVHFYGDFSHQLWREWIDRARVVAPRHLHLHSQVDQEGWVAEFSRYDAGWLHFFESQNHGDLRQANWDDLNCPSRLPALVLAGVPLLQRDNRGAVVATQSIAQSLDIGLFFEQMSELRDQLRDRSRMRSLRESVWSAREQFTFDSHADRLISFFRQIIESRGRRQARARTARGG